MTGTDFSPTRRDWIVLRGVSERIQLLRAVDAGPPVPSFRRAACNVGVPQFGGVHPYPVSGNIFVRLPSKAPTAGAGFSLVKGCIRSQG